MSNNKPLSILNGAVSDEPTDADVLNARLNEIASKIEFYLDIDAKEKGRKLQKEYEETYAKLVQLRRDK